MCDGQAEYGKACMQLFVNGPPLGDFSYQRAREKFNKQTKKEHLDPLETLQKQKPNLVKSNAFPCGEKI